MRRHTGVGQAALLAVAAASAPLSAAKPGMATLIDLIDDLTEDWLSEGSMPEGRRWHRRVKRRHSERR